MAFLDAPLYDSTLEKLALSNLLWEATDCKIEMLSNLLPQDFHEQAYCKVFNSCCELHRAGSGVTILDVHTSFHGQSWYENLGGSIWLTTTTDPLALPYQPTHVVWQNLRKMTILRLQSQLKLDYGTVEENLAKLEKEREHYFKLLPSKHHSIADAMVEILAAPPARILSPWPCLDRLTNGFARQQFVVIGARTGNGKSTMLGNVACHAAQQNLSVLYCSLEMSVRQNAKRFVTMISGKPFDSATAGEFINTIKTLEILEHCESISDIEAAAGKKHFDLIVVDYIQLLRGTGGNYDGKVAEIEDNTRRLKMLADREDCIVLAAAQLNRESDKVMREPRLSDLRSCGSIEQDADVVLLIENLEKDQVVDGFAHPQKYVEKVARSLEGKKENTKIIIAKNRDGSDGACFLLFERQLNRFIDLSGQPPLPDSPLPF